MTGLAINIGLNIGASKPSATPNDVLQSKTAIPATNAPAGMSTPLFNTESTAHFVQVTAVAGRDYSMYISSDPTFTKRFEVRFASGNYGFYYRDGANTPFPIETVGGFTYANVTRAERQANGNYALFFGGSGGSGGTEQTARGRTASQLSPYPVNGTYVQVVTTFDPTNTGVATLYGPISKPLVVEQTGYDTAAKKLLFTVTYTNPAGNPPTGYLLSYNGAGGPFVRLQLISNAVAGTAYYQSPPYSGPVGDIPLYIQQLNDPSVFVNIAGNVPTPTIVNMNDNAAASMVDNSGGINFRDPSNNSAFIRLPDRPVRSPEIQGTTNPAESNAVLYDFSGKIGSNNLGLSQYRAVLNEGYTATDGTIGPQELLITPSVAIPVDPTFSGDSGVSSWSYNPNYIAAVPGVSPAVGRATFTYTKTTSLSFNFLFNTPTEYTEFRARKVGNTGRFTQDYLTNDNKLRVNSRNLDDSSVNNATARNGTRLSLYTRTPTTRLRTAANDIETQVERAKATGEGIWANIFHIDDDATVSTYADVLIAGKMFNPNMWQGIELSNEMWNYQFSQTTDTVLLGCRAGFAEPGATPGTATPITIVDCSQDVFNVIGGTTYPYSGPQKYASSQTPYCSVNFGTLEATALQDIPANTYLFANLNGGPRVWKTNALITNTTPFTFGGSNCPVAYTNPQCNVAQKRWISSRLKQIAIIMNTKFDAAGLTRPDIILAWQTATSFSAFQEMLDWDNLKNYVTAVSIADYWCASPLDLISYQSSITNWTPADKDVFYNANSFDEGCLALEPKWASVSQSSIDAAINAYNQLKYGTNFSLRAYNQANGTSIRMYRYEWNWHPVLSGAPSKWPDNPVAYTTYNSGTTYTIGQWARVGNEVYEALTTTTGNNPPTSPSQWKLKVKSWVFTGGKGSQAFFQWRQKRPGHYDDLLYGLNRINATSGDHLTIYTKYNSEVFGIVDSETDVTSSNPRATAIINFRASL